MKWPQKWGRWWSTFQKFEDNRIGGSVRFIRRQIGPLATRYSGREFQGGLAFCDEAVALIVRQMLVELNRYDIRLPVFDP